MLHGIIYNWVPVTEFRRVLEKAVCKSCALRQVFTVLDDCAESRFVYR